MAAKMQRGLGRGLGALLGEAAETSEAARDEVRSLKLTPAELMAFLNDPKNAFSASGHLGAVDKPHQIFRLTDRRLTI